MSLKSLLATGRSFIGVRSEPTSFRMRKENLLPRFEARAEWLTRGSLPPLSLTQPELLQPAELPRKPINEVFYCEPPRKQDASLPPVIDKNAELSAAEMAARAKFYQCWPFGFILKFFQRRSRASRALVQTELALDNIKVVRNDLAESDLEVVTSPIKKQKISPFASPGSAKEPLLLPAAGDTSPNLVKVSF